MGVVIWGIEDEPDWFIGYVKEELENPHYNGCSDMGN